MYVDKNPRKNRRGQPYFSILYRDKDGKICRLQKDKHPHFLTIEEAETWAKSQVGILSAKSEEIQRKTAWKTQYYEFSDLLEKYKVYQDERAPNSWKSSVSYLEQWVFTYFLQVRKAGNVNDWHLFFEEFRLWLSAPEAMLLKGRKAPLAVNTKNNIVKALNTFLKCLCKHHLMDKAYASPCEAWPESATAQRDFEDVIQEPEMRQVYEKMKEINQPAAEFFFVLWNTGMRFSELFGLPFNWLYAGEPKEGPLTKNLARHGISYVGYIVLESQPFHDDRRRETGQPDAKGYVGAVGSIRRKPLKTHKRIELKSFRTIPIRTKELWNILAARHAKQKESFQKREFTLDKQDYPFFEDLEWNTMYNTLSQAYTALKLAPKDLHCCRHSFCTLLVGETNDFALVRMITGHRSARSFEKYLHIYEHLAQQAKQNDQEIKTIA